MATALSIPSDDTSPSTSQSVKAQRQIRELILAGTLAGGARIAELTIVEKLGISRTPIRAALMRLEQEGLLEALPSGGYAVKTFSERDVADAIELRGIIEGLLARLSAERGAPAVIVQEARSCLRQIDDLLRATTLSDDTFSQYVVLNEQFHSLLHEMAASPTITHQLERVTSLPFASPSGFVIAEAESTSARDMLVVAQDQHWRVLEAIESREGARAELIMREHSRIAQRNFQRVLHSPDALPAISQQATGVQLIRRRT